MAQHVDIAHPWNREIWDYLVTMPESSRKTHALLFCGSRGLGKRSLAEMYARHVLLGKASSNEIAFNWFEAGTHPDMHVLMSEAMMVDQSESVFSRFAQRYLEEGGANKEPKQIISIAQMRLLGKTIVSTTASDGARVVVLPDADAMNINAANSLLKNLEEPPDNTLFILISDKYGYLPATIRSRCTPIHFTIPEHDVARDWLESYSDHPARKNEKGNPIENAEELLSFSGGAPLAALGLHQTGERELHLRLLRQLCDVITGKAEPVGAAKQWHDEAPELIIRLTQRLFSDLIRCRYDEAIDPVFYKAQKQWLHSQGKRLNSQAIFKLWQKIQITARLMSGTSDKLLILELLALDLADVGK